MGRRTDRNLYDAYVGESKAHQRLKAFAKKAEEEGFKQIAKLFRAIAEAEAVHAQNHIKLLGLAKTTQENLRYSFKRELSINEVTYPQFIKEAEEEQISEATTSFSYARDVEEGHAKLYKQALEHLLKDGDTDYYVCQMCGYTSDGILPEECPICAASKDKFSKIK
ncbi:MAG: rubrerythrin [Candidatus Scalindua rubra]|uniref:Rubrerythrin n=1 Tax=Candidatus Scalindua rubra TaxID=1872076 RepID=A0A1E3XAP4_9BACT|nr:MAG: rubrerythrin [Candidatus Scalindua rubra]